MKIISLSKKVKGNMWLTKNAWQMTDTNLTASFPGQHE